MAGNKKISQLVAGGAGASGDNYVIERGGVNFKVDFNSLDPGGINISGIVNDFIVKNEKSVVALEQRLSLPAALSFVDNTAVPPTEVNGDIYLLDDTGATNAAWDGAATNSWVRFDGAATLWKEITAVDGMICEIIDTGIYRFFQSTSSTWVSFSSAAIPAGANTEIQFNAAGVFGASSLFTFDTGFGVFSCDAAAVFNEGGTDQDFRIEGLTETHLLFIEASTDRVGIATTVPTKTLHVTGDARFSDANILSSAGTTFFTANPGNTTTDWALAQTSAFATFINAKAGQTITNRINNITKTELAVSQFNIINNTLVGSISQTPLARIHAFGSSSGGSVTANTHLVVESATTAQMSFLHIEGGSNSSGIVFATDLSTTQGAIVFDDRGAGSNNTLGLSWRTGGNTTRLILDDVGNFGLGFTDQNNMHGTGAVKVFSIASGTAPSTNPVDLIQIYSLDHDGALSATLHVENEEGNTFIYKSSAAYTRNAAIVEDRTLLASASATTLNNNNVLAAMIADLQSQGLLG